MTVFVGSRWRVDKRCAAEPWGEQSPRRAWDGAPQRSISRSPTSTDAVHHTRQPTSRAPRPGRTAQCQRRKGTTRIRKSFWFTNLDLIWQGFEPHTGMCRRAIRACGVPSEVQCTTSGTGVKCGGQSQTGLGIVLLRSSARSGLRRTMKGPGPRPVRAGISDGGGMHCSSTSGGLHNREPPGTHNSSAEGAWQFGRGQHATWAGAASLRICCYNLRCRCPRAELASEIEMLNRHFDLWRSASTSATTATDRRTETLTHCGVPLLFQPAHHPQARFIIAYSALSRHTSTCEWPMHPGAHSTRQHHH